MDSVKGVIADIIEKGYASKPYIGVQLSDAADAALIYSVTENSPAAQAGLQANDIVTKANGEKIASADDLTALVKRLSVGDKLQLTVTRGGQETELTVTVGEKPQETQPAQQQNGGYDRYSGEGDSRNGDSYENYEDYFGDFFGFPFSSSGEYYRG